MTPLDTIATRAVQRSPAWPAVFSHGSSLVLWRAAVEALESAGYAIVRREDAGRPSSDPGADAMREHPL